ncbi:MAG: beta-galactosidase trimerization domain-containing protein [Verrucomicrobia bacterium]|nr:beta-galactosidase trimerization domain-containing protein [Verrucomicrobiota bacterium]MCG2681565.1 beta-galactosidase trimerization domain-containing protein [Kiritimatiellia bacterium]MBU4248119.1 beta-galactosidase trimerization domain-containing protein [Verrucomicrobiota bacterium]MBU4290647.1 beta-galactosidase trimerization domain-containing protein [Verrucomicrobiota bacterium]MBU4428093.1 beta-galactosidase trimerization domain-containing protein [Verrucomicrobiota bacterium]
MTRSIILGFAVLVTGLLIGVPLNAAMKVGVFDAGLTGSKSGSGKGIVEGLADMTDVTFEYIGDLSLTNLIKFDVVVLPGIYPSGPMENACTKTIPAYAAVGGGVVMGMWYCQIGFDEVFLHRGESWFLRGDKGTKKYAPAVDHPVTQGIKEYESAYTGYMLIDPAPGAVQILKAVKGRGAGVAGEFGLGRVVALGGVLGKQGNSWNFGDDVPVQGDEANLLKNAVRWVGEKKKVSAENLELFLNTLGTDIDGRLKGRIEWMKEIRSDQEKKSGILKKEESIKILKTAWASFTEDQTALRQELASIRTDLAKFKNTKDLKLDAGHLVVRMRDYRKALDLKTMNIGLALADAGRMARLAEGLSIERKQVRFARGFYYPGASIRNAGPDIVLHLRRMQEEFHANFVTAAFKRYEKKDKWAYTNDAAVIDRYLGAADLFGLSSFAIYHYGVLDRGWPGMKEANEYYARHPSFGGLIVDEPFYNPFGGNWGEANPDPSEEFSAYVKEHYQPEERTKLGIRDEDLARIPKPEEIANKRALWAILGEFCRDKIGGFMKRDLTAVRSIDPSLIATMDLQGVGYPVWYTTLAELGGGIIMCEPYDRASYRQVATEELLRGAQPGKVWKWIAPALPYAWHSEADYRKSLYQAMAHGEGIGIFLYTYLIDGMTGYSGDRKCWQPDLINPTKEVFAQIEKLEDYLVDTKSTAKTAILVCERSSWNDFFKSNIFLSNVMGLFEKLVLNGQVQTDYVFTELLNRDWVRERMKRYRLIFAPCAISLSKDEVAVLRDWVKQGGMLVAGGGMSRRNEFGLDQPDYGLADVLGVKYKKTVTLENAVIIVPTNSTLAAATNKFEKINGWGDEVQSGRNTRILAQIEGATLTAASPAITCTQVGKGWCVFVAPWNLGELPVALLDALLKFAVKTAKIELNLMIANCPPGVDFTLRAQPEKKRLVLHLLDQSNPERKLSGVEVSIPVGKGSNPSVTDAMNGAMIVSAITGAGDVPVLKFTVPPWEFYKLIVIEDVIPAP